MFDALIASIFGIVQGLTEFLPISSSGHLIVLHKIFSLNIANELSFDVALHMATLLAVVSYFWSDIVLLFVSWLKSFNGKGSAESRLAWLIILSTIPAGLAGFWWEDFIENDFRAVGVVAAMLFLVAILIILVEKYSRRSGEINSLNPSKAVFIGLAQALALIPGTSRSGITIIAGMAAGLNRQAAIKFSFLMSVPIIFGAGLKKIPHLVENTMAGGEVFILIIAFIATYLSGFVAIKYLIKFTRNNSLNIFAYYRILLAVVLMIFFLYVG